MKRILKYLNVYKELNYRSMLAADLSRQTSIVERLVELPIDLHQVMSLIKLVKKSHSELGQDLLMLLCGNFKDFGVFIEVGANDGSNCSNTKLLEDNFNWRGIVSEPNPKYSKILSNRKCYTDFNIVHSTSKEKLYINDLSSLSYVSNRKKSKKGSWVSTITLDDLINQHFDHNKVEIDFVSIDTEGHELEILSKFPFDKWNIGYFIIEHNYKSEKLIDSFMSHAGYIRFLEKWSKIDAYYCHPSKKETLKKLNLSE
jgi:FkbM family methyltransferase